MRWVILILAFVLVAGSSHAQPIRVTTWNLHWFPSGSANRASPEVEQQRIQDAAKVIEALNPDVLLLQEVRDWDSCDRLAKAITSATYHVLVCSAFKEPVGGIIGWQQVGILSKRPADAAWSESWKSTGKTDPPRGFAFAAIRFEIQLIGFYSIHLKSNLVRGNAETEVQKNILKREIAANELVRHSNEIRSRVMPAVQSFVIGGDFNTNRDEATFASEATLTTLEEAGFIDAFTGIEKKNRITHPSKGRYPDATFDYLFTKGLRMIGTVEILKSPLSDHWPVTCQFRTPKNTRRPTIRP